MDPRQTESISFEGVCVLAVCVLALSMDCWPCRCCSLLHVVSSLMSCLDVKQLSGTLTKGGRRRANSSCAHAQRPASVAAATAQPCICSAAANVEAGHGWVHNAHANDETRARGGSAQTLAARFVAALQCSPVSRGIGRNPRVDCPCGVGGHGCIVLGGRGPSAGHLSCPAKVWWHEWV